MWTNPCRMGHVRLAAVAGLLILATPCRWTQQTAGATYYVSSVGADENDGRSPETAWRTIGRVNSVRLAPGDVVLFRRGDAWREPLVPATGSPDGYITYGAYGSGNKPLLLGSVAKNGPEDWIRERDNIWATAEPSADGRVLYCDVGNVIFDRGADCGVKVFNESDLDAQGEYWYDEKRRRLKLYSTQSPVSLYRGVECALRRHIVNQSNKSYVVYENLALRYGGAHGIGGGNTHHIIVRDCDFAFIGGGDQHGGERTVRFGNGVEFWGNAHDCLVERCRLWEIYDAALTNQNNGPNVKQVNITYRNNVIWNCEYSFEYWNRPASSRTWNIRFENNTCVGAGHGWGHTQRPDPSGRHLCFYGSPAPAQEIVIRNNIFFGAKGNAFYAPSWEKSAIDALRTTHNCWHQPDGVMLRVAGREYSGAEFAAFQAAFALGRNSIVADPQLADVSGRDFRLTKQSPCIDAGAETDRQSDFAGTPVPQGTAPDIGAYEYVAP